MSKMIHVSDLSGTQIPEGKGATISIRFADARKAQCAIRARSPKRGPAGGGRERHGT